MVQPGPMNSLNWEALTERTSRPAVQPAGVFHPQDIVSSNLKMRLSTRPDSDTDLRGILVGGQTDGCQRSSGISTRTAEPFAVTTPPTETSVSTMALRPVISTNRPVRHMVPSGVGSR